MTEYMTPQEQREVRYLGRVKCKTSKEIADQLGLKTSTVSSYLKSLEVQDETSSPSHQL